MRTYGVKKPLEEKKDKIDTLKEDYQRYYPVDRHGQLDEWGAVIKRQAETYQKEQQDKAIQKVQDQNKYFEDLAN
jgi:hypothetical protein